MNNLKSIYRKIKVENLSFQGEKSGRLGLR